MRCTNLKMTDKRFARTIRRVSRRQTRRGQMSRGDYLKVVSGSRDMATVKQWRAKIEQPQYSAPWTGKVLTAADWPGLFQWLCDHWFDILKILLSLLVFLGEQPDENPSTAETLPKDDNDVLRSEGQV